MHNAVAALAQIHRRLVQTGLHHKLVRALPQGCLKHAHKLCARQMHLCGHIVYRPCLRRFGHHRRQQGAQACVLPCPQHARWRILPLRLLPAMANQPRQQGERQTVNHTGRAFAVFIGQRRLHLQ